MAPAAPAVVLEVIGFNWDPASTQDGLSLRRNATAAGVLPEWREGFCVRPEDAPAAYSIHDTAGRDIVIRARFRRTDPTLSSVEVRALEGRERGEDDDRDDALADAECGNVLGRVGARTVAFGGGGQTGMEPFTLHDVRLHRFGVGVRTVTWRWQYRLQHGGPWRAIATTRHRVYSLLRVPTAPWQMQPLVPGNLQLPWTEVLDRACGWAQGAGTCDEAAAMVTRAVYRLGPAVVTYDCPGGGSTHYAWPSFDCTAFLDRLDGGPGNGYYVNCTDCATITSTFANALGCDLWQSRMGYSFALNEMLGIGSTTWQTCCGWGAFSYHEVAWEAACDVNDDVFDACLQVDGDADPTTAPHTALLPMDLRFGNPGDGVYRDRLATPAGRATCAPQTATRQRRAVV